MKFIDRLVTAIHEKNSVTCVGIDPVWERMPAYIIAEAEKTYGKTWEAAGSALLEFGKGIIDAVHDLVPAIKPQMAFFEQYGYHGLKAFEEICAYAAEHGLLVIADGKRNDIDSTAKAYADAYLGETDLFGEKKAAYQIDALTVSAYLGFDGIKPFTANCDKFKKGIFVLVKTSNPSAGDLQDRYAEDGLRNFEYMAHFVESWGADLIGDCGFSEVGAVVGATYPKDVERLRSLMPTVFFLIPGYGAQGASAKDIAAAFDKDGLGAVVNASRSIIYAYEAAKTTDYKKAAREATEAMNRDLRG